MPVMDDLINDAIRRMDKSVETTQHEFNSIRTGRASAALRALEIGADAILMGKNEVDGVYDGDPNTESGAALLPELTHLEAIERGLKIMDTTALSLCMDNSLPIYVFGLEDRSLKRVISGERVGTIISTPKESS